MRRRARPEFPDSFLPSVAKAADAAMEDVLLEDFLRHHLPPGEPAPRRTTR